MNLALGFGFKIGSKFESWFLKLGGVFYYIRASRFDMKVKVHQDLISIISKKLYLGPHTRLRGVLNPLLFYILLVGSFNFGISLVLDPSVRSL
jgi:hypothetical protein